MEAAVKEELCVHWSCVIFDGNQKVESSGSSVGLERAAAAAIVRKLTDLSRDGVQLLLRT